MKITTLEPILVNVPLRAPVSGVHGVTTIQQSVLVRVATDAGHEGWGNVDPTPGYSKVSAESVHAAVGRLASPLLGVDPFNIHAALARMDREAAVASEAKAAV